MYILKIRGVVVDTEQRKGLLSYLASMSSNVINLDSVVIISMDERSPECVQVLNFGMDAQLLKNTTTSLSDIL